MSAPGDAQRSAAAHPQIAADDWSDQDLLTKDEARLRVAAGVRAAEAELERARTAAPERVAELERYLQRARAVLERIRR